MVEKVEESIFKEVVKIPLLGYSNGNKDYQKAKIPIISGWQKEDFRGMNETEEEYHIARGGWIGLRIPEGYILVDIDDEAVGELVFWALREEGIKSHVMKTPRGWQFFFKDNGKVASQTSKVMAKSGVVVDYRLAGRGYTVLPSENTEGREWKCISSDELSFLPFLFEPLKTLKADDNVVIPILKGRRNDTLFKHVNRLRTLKVNEEEIRKTIFFMNRYFTEEPLPRDEIEKIIKIRDNYDYELTTTLLIEKPTSLEEVEIKFTESWNASKFAEMFKGKVIWCEPWGVWLHYEGGKWVKDDLKQILTFAKQVPKQLYAEASKIQTDAERKELVKWAIKTDNKQALLNMLELAKPDLAVTPDVFDSKPFLLNLKNGTFDLENYELLPHNPDDYLTMMANVEYIEDAECPRWIKFLNTIFNNDEEIISFIQRAVGYSLSGDVGEDCFFFLYGTGANGKTTFLNTIQEILGDYAIQARAETFILKDKDYIPNDIARMHNKRFVVATEFPEGKRISESLLKSLTGRDTISARFLRQEFFDFKPTFKLWFGANHKLIVYENTYAFWRRVKMIPFNVQIPENEQIPHFEDYLLEEKNGILKWAIDGFDEWQRNRLSTPQEIQEAVEEYKQESDILADFIGEKCVENANYEVLFKDLYNAYVEWAEENKEKIISKQAFGRRLGERGYKSRKSMGQKIWIGITLKEH